MRTVLRSMGRFAQRQAKIIAAIGAGLVIGAGTVAVFAVIPDTNGVIHACYRTNNGSIRIIDSATQTCAGNEAAITWNQTGPQGSQGPAGPQGPQGPAGSGDMVANLVGANFSNASLQYRNFAGRDMHGSNFTNAILTGSDLSNANLSGSIISASNSMRLVNASGANFSEATINTGFSGGAAGANFQNADFSNAIINSLGGADLRTAIFTNTSFKNILNNNLSGVDLTSITFQPGGTFSESDLTNTNLSGLAIPNFFFGGTTLNGTNFSNVMFSGTNFNDTNLSAANITGATWSNVICPDSTNSDANGNTCVGHLVP
jgi:uncharacterized protein YjbI with pentapeptide repeats